jgi:hypothetical protein
MLGVDIIVSVDVKFGQLNGMFRLQVSFL